MAAPEDAERRFHRAREMIDRGRQALAEGHRQMRQLSGEMTVARSRGAIHQHIWDCERMSNRRAHFFSQSGQDAYLDERLFRGKRGGVFVEIGGYDGLTGSNCLFFELLRGWSGLLIEPSPRYHAKAAEFRRAACLQVAVAEARGEGGFIEVAEGLTQMSGLAAHYPAQILEKVEADPRHKAARFAVKTRPLAEILSAHHLTEIDYVSLDAMGAEQAILEAFPFGDFKVTAWSVDNATENPAIVKLMRERGYKRVEALGADDIFVHDPD